MAVDLESRPYIFTNRLALGRFRRQAKLDLRLEMQHYEESECVVKRLNGCITIRGLPGSPQLPTDQTLTFQIPNWGLGMAWRIRVLADCFPVRGLTIALALVDESQGQWKGVEGCRRSRGRRGSCGESASSNDKNKGTSPNRARSKHAYCRVLMQITMRKSCSQSNQNLSILCYRYEVVFVLKNIWVLLSIAQ